MTSALVCWRIVTNNLTLPNYQRTPKIRFLWSNPSIANGQAANQ
jgi:hypothetical protein